jgi:hypothetical protein
VKRTCLFEFSSYFFICKIYAGLRSFTVLRILNKLATPIIFWSLAKFTSMRTQLRCKTMHSLPMCPIVHNISGQMFMTQALLPSFEKASLTVCSRKIFGKNRCMYTLVGNVIFEVGKKHVFFKGVRSVAAMQRMIERATCGEIDVLRVSMLVSTMQLHRRFSVQVGCPLENALRRELKNDVVILPRTEEESNAFIFKVQAWNKLTEDPQIIHEMRSMITVISISRFGNCTLRVSTDRDYTVCSWLHAQSQIHEALHCIATFMCTRDFTNDAE